MSNTEEEPMMRIERMLTQLLLAVQHQSIELARLQDEFDALRERQTETLAQLHADVIMAGKRTDWFDVQLADVLRVTLRELREIRATQVFAALSDGAISAQLLAELVHPVPDEELLLDLPPRARSQ